MVHVVGFDIQCDIGGVGCIHTCLTSSVVETGIFILDFRILIPPLGWLAVMKVCFRVIWIKISTKQLTTVMGV